MSVHAIVVDRLLEFVRQSQNTFEVEFGKNVVFRSTAGSESFGSPSGSCVRGVGCRCYGVVERGDIECDPVRVSTSTVEIINCENLVGGIQEGDERIRKFREESVGRGSVASSPAGASSVGADDKLADELRCDKYADSDGTSGVSEKTLLNRLARKRAKERKLRKKARQALGETPVTDLRANVEIVPVEQSQVPEWRRENGKKVPGFWNSCSPDVRQELIDSKARMHIAENKRKAKEAEDRVAYLNSPQAIMDKVVKLAEKAQAAAEKEKNGRIFGWAKIVATSNAESLARSTPDSIPSFDTFDEEQVKSLVEAEQEKTAAVRQEMAELEKEMHGMMDRHAHEMKKLQDALAKAVDDKVKKARAEENKAPERLPGESPKAHFQRTQRMRAAKRAEVESHNRVVHQNVPGGFDWSDVPDRVMGF